MDNFHVVEKNNNVLQKNKELALLKNGLSNITLYFLSGFVFHFVIDNYISYGIVKGPIEILFNFYDFLTEAWWIFLLVPICLAVQICLCFTIEKCLALKILTETIGMALHVFNTFLVMNIIAAVSYISKSNPVALHIFVGHTGVQFLKMISYVYVNRINRENTTDVPKINGKENEENYDINNKLIRYPQNITISNTFDYFVCSGSFIYTLEKVPKAPKNWKRAFQSICCGVLIYYVCGLLTYQFVIPELRNAKRFIDNFQILQLLGVFFKLLFPVNLVWVLHYQFWCFYSVLPLNGYVWGTKQYVYYLDWWNSENMTIFWKKWNHQTHLLLKHCIFSPLTTKGYSKMQSAFMVALISGFLHEYLVSFTFRGSYGLPTMAMLAQIPFAAFTTYFHKTVGPEFGNYLTMLSLLSGNTVSIISVYYNYNYE